MSKSEEDARATLIAMFEKELQAAMPVLRARSVISQPVHVFHSARMPLLIGSLAPHDTVQWFSIPGLRSHASDYGLAVNGRLIVWHSRKAARGYYYYSNAAERLSNEELQKAIAALQQLDQT